MEILREIQTNEYQCLICHEDITPKSRIWSCNICNRVFDQKCTLNWSSRKPGPEWTCPHCSAPYTEKPNLYRCWCKKVRNPDIDWDRPHSCGQSCGAKRKCPHPCTEICHPGNHPPCTAIGTVVKCFCGKEKKQDICIRTNYQGFSCDQVCGKTLACKKHKCELPCHKGPCPPCEKSTNARCYCGKSHKKMGCGQGKREKYRNLHGRYACGKLCSRKLDCGNHTCDLECHPLSGFKHVCTQQPAPTDTCNCGKTLLSYYGLSRKSCTDPIPNCNRYCEKIMPCGHKCPQKCHAGPCTCLETVVKTCRCGRTKAAVHCSESVPPCTRKCGAPLLCGRHKCQLECCEFSNGKNRIKKNMSLDDFLVAANSQMSDQELAVHLCTETCNRTLACGIHTCGAVCHPGQCRRCMQAVHQDYECPCGKTKMLAPIPCGTQIPDCKHQCPIVQPCGHSGGHKCHDPTKEPCPPCNAVVSEKCWCGKNMVNKPCGSDKPSKCFFACGKPLDCGHTCKTQCHQGPCPPCQSACGRPLGCINGHNHDFKCHGDSECGECTTEMIARCKCDNLRVTYECGEEYQVFCNETCLNTEPPYHQIIFAIYEDRTGWCSKIERELREFMASQKQAYGFKPMKKSDRRFVHYLAEHYGLVGVSVDQGANRSVRVNRTETSWTPKITIGRAIKLARIHTEYLPTRLDIDAIEDVGLSD